MNTVVCDFLEDGTYKMKDGKILTQEQFDKLDALMPDYQFIIIKHYGAPKRNSNREQVYIDFNKAL